MSAAPANASWSRVPAPGFRVTTAGTHRWAGRGHADADKAPCRPFQNVNSGMFWWTTFCAVLLDRTSTMLLLLAILASGHGSVIFGLYHGKRIGRSSQSLLFTQMVLLFLYIKKKRERDSEDSSYPILGPCGRFRTLCAASSQGAAGGDM
jgi:hypothetical protein